MRLLWVVMAIVMTSCLPSAGWAYQKIYKRTAAGVYGTLKCEVLYYWYDVLISEGVFDPSKTIDNCKIHNRCTPIGWANFRTAGYEGVVVVTAVDADHCRHMAQERWDRTMPFVPSQCLDFAAPVLCEFD